MKLTLSVSIVMLLFLAQLGFGQEDYNSWLKEQKKEYKEFISRQDKEFIGFLKQNWVQVSGNEGANFFRSPEPPKPEIFSPEKKTGIPTESPVVKMPAKKVNIPPSKSPGEGAAVQPPSETSAAEKSVTNLPAGTPVFNIDYFGRTLSVPQDKSLDIPFTGKISNAAVADYWEKLCKTDYKVLLDRLRALRDEMALNDWGYCKLLFETSRNIDHNDRNSSYLLTWFMLVKSGYLVRIGYRGDKVYLLVSTDNVLYDVPFFHMGTEGPRYYILILDNSEKEPSGAILTYKDNYPGSSRQINFGFSSLPKLGSTVEKSVINVEYKGKNYSFHVDYNRDLIQFYRFYPTTNLQVYFASQMSRDARSTLLPDLKSAIHGMKETAAVNFLLHFVQYATGYKTDPEQFGHQKFFFPDENLHYKYTDCADRAIFFSYLVRNLLGLKVIGLEYPDHLSTAVRFTADVSGDYVMYDHAKYVICDPTYIGAPIGEAMPKYVHMAAKIVE